MFSIHKNELQAIFFFHIKFIYSTKKTKNFEERFMIIKLCKIP